jgi:adenylosuccinate lyase
MLTKTIYVLENLDFKPENIKRNLMMTRGLIMAENVMVKMVEKGMGRQEAHEAARKAAMRVYDEGIMYSDALKADATIKKYLSDDEIDDALKPENYIGTAVEQVDAVLKKLR